MKKHTILALGVLMFLAIPLLALGASDVASGDKMEIGEAIKSIEDAVNLGDANAIMELMSPNTSLGLKNAIRDRITGAPTSSFGNPANLNAPTSFQQSINSYETISLNKVEVKGRFIASGAGWNVSGASNYFIFEKIDGRWLLLETDFHTKFGFFYIGKTIFNLGKTVGKIFLFIILPILVIFGIFWLWMLIDVIQRPVENKRTWILLVIALQALGAILYFFVARRKHKKLQ